MIYTHIDINIMSMCLLNCVSKFKIYKQITNKIYKQKTKYVKNVDEHK